mmetsp:Transcript_29188/g.35466  ORF Transcript_29188/g.35466 Transcript_29188/m.35466 type:complete len:419 (+) Transcript_29188:75-1331(+)|eukprot:CAMPEP_0197848924 /NCGR_PEP_ID=MMETSP1438-20131217/10517_1 /TAXON_ID=1461541 /ORGANISM="Pterosperma sp., Strain CCMP1384" /LENGTH=418 /DNA_ID=CAMNT_0043461399 /DNA_START=265 /DNA_END=1521 /DNA_ORIENTATION=+
MALVSGSRISGYHSRTHSGRRGGTGEHTLRVESSSLCRASLSARSAPAQQTPGLGRCFGGRPNFRKAAPLGSKSPPSLHQERVKHGVKLGGQVCKSAFGAYGDSCPIEDGDDDCTFLNLVHLRELLTELLAVIAEFDEPFEGALTAKVYLDDHDPPSNHNVQLSLEIYTREELVYPETRELIRQSSLETKDEDVQLVLIVQRLQVDTITTLPGGDYSSSAFVSGTVPRHALEWEFSLFSQSCEEEKLDEWEALEAGERGSFPNRDDGSFPHDCQVSAPHESSSARSQRWHPEVPDSSDREAFGIVVATPRGSIRYLFAEKRVSEEYDVESIASRMSKQRAGRGRRGRSRNKNQGPRRGMFGDDLMHDDLMYDEELYDDDLIEEQPIFSERHEREKKMKLDVKYAVYDPSTREILNLLQ